MRVKPLFLLLALALAAGCQSPGRPPATEPVEVTDRFVFQVFDPALRPLGGAVVQVVVEAGRALGPLTLTTDQAGEAVLALEAQSSPLVRTGRESADVLIGFRSAITYRIEAPGRLTVWGRAELRDSLERFVRSSFSTSMDKLPRNKTRPIRAQLPRVEDFFAPGALDDPLARTVAASLPDLWQTWAVTDRLSRIKPLAQSWSVDRRAEGAFLKADLAVLDSLEENSDIGISRVFESQLVPLLDDLAARLAPFLDGWELTFHLGYLRDKNDPHAMPEEVRFRLVFSESLRARLITHPGGLNWLLIRSQEATLDDQPWQPLQGQEREQERQDFIWDVLPPLFAPGPEKTG